MNVCPRKKDERKLRNGDKEANIGHDDGESDTVPLMATTCEGNPLYEHWYIYSGCSNHITWHKKWLANFNQTRRLMLNMLIKVRL